MIYKNLNIFLLIIIFSIASCREKLKYENTGIQINYLDSLSNISFLDSIIPISYTNIDAINLKNRYLELGRQNIDLHLELRKAAELKKPILIYFTAYGCVNCRKMEELVLENNEINSFIKKEFELIPLCVDDRTKLPESHWQENPYQNENTIGGQPLNRIGSINSHFQIVLSQTGSQPLFVAIDENRKLGNYNFTNNTNEFMQLFCQI